MNRPQLDDRPAHVPQALALDFDFVDFQDVAEDPQRAWKQIMERHPIFWTPRYGGHWVVTRAADVREILMDTDLFSSEFSAIPPQLRPRNLPEPPVGIDPPAHTQYRRILNGPFSPRAIRELEPFLRSVIIELIESFSPRGHCEFVAEFARQFPIIVFMKLAGVPLRDREMLLALVEERFRAPDSARQIEAAIKISEYTGELVRRKRAAPGEDIYSKIALAEIDGALIPEHFVHSIFRVLLVGGLDSVASSLTFAMRHLASHEEDRGHIRAVLDDQQKLGRARDELLRRYGVSIMTRRVARDANFRSIEFRTDDRILIPTMTHDLDDREFASPLIVDFNRTPKQAATFGIGMHFCLGAHLARSEWLLFLQEWFRRIPDFSIEPGTSQLGHGGLVMSLDQLRLVWPKLS